MTKIHLQGYIDVPQDRLDAVSTALPVHISLTQDEPGCISFNVTSCPNVKGRYLVNEVFETQQAFDDHQSRTASSEWAKISNGLVRHYKINKI